MVDVYLSAREIDSYIAIFRRKQIVRRTSSCATSCLITILWTKILSMTIGKNFNKKEVTMGTSSATISRLREHQSATPSRWRENAEWRMKNRSWLRYSQRIAMMMLDKMEEMNMSQKQLSELMGCSQQYVSKVLKGQENLSLETMSKIEACLGIQILPTSEV